jgi:hypothetical protein
LLVFAANLQQLFETAKDNATISTAKDEMY